MNIGVLGSGIVAKTIAGKLDSDRHTRTVQRLQAEIANRQAEIGRLERQQATDADIDSRRVALLDIMRNGPAILRSADATSANVWLRRHVRVWIRSREMLPEETIVEWLPKSV